MTAIPAKVVSAVPVFVLAMARTLLGVSPTAEKLAWLSLFHNQKLDISSSALRVHDLAIAGFAGQAKAYEDRRDVIGMGQG